ncbi:MAG: glycosyltransferase family 2 protein [Acidobacteriales bacterium]|nr:glycosyltransferase family 2 protein [Terriglobales bacterium]
MATYLIGILGILLGAGWIIRLAQIALGMRTIPDLRAPEWDLPASARCSPRVSIIVPARNEEQAIEAAMRSLLALEYPSYDVIAVNDRSTDATPEILTRLASNQRLRVIHITDLPPGWLGKANAMATGLAQATAEWILFTDADVCFRPDTLRRAIGYAERSAADHLVLFPTMLMETWAERMVGGFFECMFLLWWGHSPWKVADPKSGDYLGAGAFNLVKRSTLQAIGGVEPLRMEVIEDMKLGKLVKRAGFQQRMVFGQELITLHWARGAFGVVRNLTKNFFALVNYRWPLALAAIMVVLAVNVAPFVGAIAAPGWTRLGYIAAVGCIAAMYMGMGRYSPISPGYLLLHPVGALLIAYSILRSTVLTLWRDGVVWRGTKYPLDELRRGIV